MDKAVKLRTTIRSTFTRTCNALLKHLSENRIEESKASFNVLEDKWMHLQEKDEEILKFMVDDDKFQDEDFEKEEEVKLEYQTKYELMKVKINNLEIPASNRIGSRGFDDDDKCSLGLGTGNSSLRLPTIKLDTFDGNLKNWLPFWGQFEIIHKDDSIPTFHKFRILSQSLKDGSRAKQVVDSFPISKEVDNYNAAVEALKERFGQEDLLIEVYIRELLEMIVQNSKSCQLTLADLYDKLECQLRFLEILGVTTGKSAAILCPLLESCMSEEFLRVWQRSYISDEVKDAEKRLGKFREFIKAEVQNEQRISLAMTKFGISDSGHERKFTPNNSGKNFKSGTVQKRKEMPSAIGLLAAHEHKQTCIFCDQSHNSTDCFKARDMSLEDKLKRVRDSKSCYLCLKRSHCSKQCKLRISCMLCDKKHATILCPSFTRSKNAREINNRVPDESRNEEKPINVTTTASVTCDTTVLLPTVQLKLKNGNGKPCIVRAVIDTGSQRSYVLNSTALNMGFEDNGGEKLCVSLFGGKKSGINYHKKFLIHLYNLKEDFNCLIEALGQDVICGDLPTIPNGPWIEEMVACGIEVSDLLHDSSPVELLLGADVAGSLLTGNMKKLSSGSLVGIETYLGWTISGRIPPENRKKSTTAALITTNMLCNNLNVSDLWRLDLLGIDDKSVYKTKNETEAETVEFFLDTVTTNEDGRYEVRLPWKSNHSPLPVNFELASKRLDSTRQRLQKDGFLDEYDAVLKEWEAEGIIKEIPVANEGHFLPHHHVIKLNSTTKVRPVFDASAQQKSTCSLNQCLERGCNLIEEVPSLLNSFRLKEVGVIADIRRAFLQISISLKDRKYLKFLWKNPNGDLISFQHNRVVFGLTSSPFLLGAVIQYHLKNLREKALQENSNYYLATIDKLLKCFYVDNVVTSVDTIEAKETFQSEATAIMAEGKFVLRDWEHTDLQSDKEGTSSVLGLKWSSKEDVLSISTDNLSPETRTEKVTKRTILSFAHRLFDPLGIASPVSICPKLLLKELWELKIEWDDEVPKHIRTKFNKWKKELMYLGNISVPRWLLLPNPIRMSIHTFVDASEQSYATAIFVRTENEYEVKVQLVQSKTRISPVKEVTIPRLELLAATIGARLFSNVEAFFDRKCDYYFWTDSSTVLAWLKRNENWSIFVSNRVNEIKKLTDIEHWHHIPGKMNPADLPSRGCLGKILIESKWWEGPDWLYLPSQDWPSSECNFDEGMIVTEKKKSVTCSTMMTSNSQETDNWYWNYFSQYLKMIRMVAWIGRFIANCKIASEDPTLMKRDQLTVEEINNAELKVLKFVQKEAFNGVEDPNIRSLQPFEDHLGLIRLKTKVSNRVDSPDFRFPILLPKNHPVVFRLLRHVHENECHVGVQGLLGITRERFWVMGGRRTMKKGKKTWICLFVYGVYRAIHLELLTSLNTEDFLLAFRRFVARRGRPTTVYSDQGTNFKGANNFFLKLNWSKVLEYCDVKRISWKFNPPAAPWWGGWWEQLVGLTKQLLRRVLRRSTMTYAEMETVICDCESVLNSRPLTYIYEGSSEPTFITPSMFIQDVREAGLPELDTLESCSFEKRWQHRNRVKLEFKRRFRNEYLGLLQQRTKRVKANEINLGDVVLIGSDNSKRMNWPLAKVIETIPGRDGVTRLVRLKTADGECLRAIQRVYPLLEGQGLKLDQDHLFSKKPKK